jgi:alpha-beta hydrolase superfamily lysophospholipase
MGGLIVTHFGLRVYHEDPMVKGFILSAPAYRNSIKVSRFVIAMGRLLSRIAPRMAVPIDDLRPHVTHDEGEYNRMGEDERDGIQATKLSARMGNEYLKAQECVPEHIAEWNHPLLAIIPGDDRLADSQFTLDLFSRLGKGLLTLHQYPDNYHESFNELNREEVFSGILEWCEPLLK